MTITLAVLATVVLASLCHVVVDFCFQTKWMVGNKQNVKHPAGYVHATIVAFPMLLFFPLWATIVIGATHFLIDTKIPLNFWMKLMGSYMPKEPWFFVLSILTDQIWHISIIAILALICGGR